MFKFKKPIVVPDEKFLSVVNHFKSKNEMKAFDDYSLRAIDDSKLIRDREKGRYHDYYLDEDSQGRKDRYTANKDLRKERVSELRSMFSDDFAVAERVYCPYTNKLLREYKVHIPFLNFKKKIEVFRYTNGDKVEEYKYSVLDLTKVDFKGSKLDTLGKNYAKEVIDVFKDEWTFEKEQESKVGVLALNNVDEFVIVKDDVDRVRVYYPHTMSYEDKKVYFSAKNGRFYKYKKNRYIPSPDIEDFDKKLKKKLT